jgi:hypothetical protein
MKKHVDVDHVLLVKKRPNVFSFEISNVFGANDPFKKDDVQQNNFRKTFAFWLSKITYLFNLWKVHVEASCNSLMSKSCISI